MADVRWSLISLFGVLVGCGVGPDPMLSSPPNGPTAAMEDVGVGDAPVRDGGANSARSVSKNADNCGRQTFRTREVVPDMLIVLDRSASMQTREDRWTPAVAAIKSLTSTFELGVSFGLMLFPAVGDDACAIGSVRVSMATGNASNIARELAGTAPGGATPTGESLQAALRSFQQAASASPESRQPRYVLLVTDGEPSCPTAEGSTTRSEDMEADKELTLQAIDALRAEQIETFVLGYDGSLDTRFARALTEFAQHGGTDSYYIVSDEESLGTALESIADAVISCGFELESDPPDPQLVHVTLNGVTLRLDDRNGFSLSGRTVTIRGEACSKLQAGKDQQVEITLECAPVVYL